MNAIFVITLQCVDGNNRLVVIEERIVIRRQLGSNALNLVGIKSNQRNGETVPHFFLELGHHALDRNHQYSFALATLDEFTHQDARFKRFT